MERLTDPDVLAVLREHGCACEEPKIEAVKVTLCPHGGLHTVVELAHDVGCPAARAAAAATN